MIPGTVLCYTFRMRKFFLVLLLSLVVWVSGYGNVFAFAKGEQDCSKCHTLNQEQAKDALKDVIPGVKILDIQPGPINGLWEISMESDGRKGILYLDFSKKRVIAGNIFDIKTKTNYTKDSFDRINKVDLSSFPYENSLVLGDKDAKYRVIVFDDPD